MRYNEILVVQGYYNHETKIGDWIFYNTAGQKIIEGSFIRGEKNGTWNYYKNGQLRCQINYDHGILQGELKKYKNRSKAKEIYHYDNGELIDKDKNPIDLINDFYFIADEMPLFLGQEIRIGITISCADIVNEATYFHSYLNSEIKKINISSKGSVFVEFTVGLYGEICQVRMTKGFSEEENQQIINIFKNLPFFEPGYMDGLPANVRYTQPICFD